MQQSCTQSTQGVITLSLRSGGSGGGNAGGTLGGLAVPFLRGGHLRSSMHRSYSVGLANSPVNGLLYVRGTIGECCPPPEKYPGLPEDVSRHGSLEAVLHDPLLRVAPTSHDLACHGPVSWKIGVMYMIPT